jgi:hypothetical protein
MFVHSPHLRIDAGAGEAVCPHPPIEIVKWRPIGRIEAHNAAGTAFIIRVRGRTAASVGDGSSGGKIEIA